MHRKTHWAAVAVLSMACAGAAIAQAKDKGTTMGGAGAKAGAKCLEDDQAKLRSVLSYLHDANQNTIKNAKLALDRAASQEVKEFADRMVKDHTDADAKLTELAKKKSIDLSISTMDPIEAAIHVSDTKLQQSLEGKSGTAFEAAYIGPEPFEHMMALAVVDEGMKVAKDEEVKKLLGDLKTALTAHRDHAMKVSDKMKIGTSVPKSVGGGPSGKMQTP